MTLNSDCVSMHSPSRLGRVPAMVKEHDQDARLQHHHHRYKGEQAQDDVTTRLDHFFFFDDGSF